MNAAFCPRHQQSHCWRDFDSRNPDRAGWELAHHLGLAPPVPQALEQEGFGRWLTEDPAGQPRPTTTLGRIGGAAERGFGEGLAGRYVIGDPAAPLIGAGAAAAGDTANELFPQGGGWLPETVGTATSLLMSPFTKGRGAPPPTTGGGIGGLVSRFVPWLGRHIPEAVIGEAATHYFGLPTGVGAIAGPVVSAIGRAGSNIAQNAIRLPGLAARYGVLGAMTGTQGTIRCRRVRGCCSRDGLIRSAIPVRRADDLEGLPPPRRK